MVSEATDLTVKHAVAIITSSDPKEKKSFGSGFAVYRDANSTFFVTCAHVVTEVGGAEKILVDGNSATIVDLDTEAGFDVAILKVDKFLDKPILKLKTISEKKGLFITEGYSAQAQGTQKRPISGNFLDSGATRSSGDKQSEVKIWDLTITSDAPLRKGYSGSPLVDRSDHHVVGIINWREGEGKGFAISIEALEKVWKGKPPDVKAIPSDLIKKFFVEDSVPPERPKATSESEIFIEVKGDRVTAWKQKDDMKESKIEFENLQEDEEIDLLKLPPLARRAINLQKDTISLRQETITVFQEWLSLGNIRNHRDLQVMGKYLFQVLFNGDVRDFFEKEFKEIPKGERLRIQLVFNEESKADKIAILPWECMFYESYFLSIHPKLILSRFIPSKKEEEPTTTYNPLRVLIVVSQPERDSTGKKDMPRLELEKVVQRIKGLDDALKNKFKKKGIYFEGDLIEVKVFDEVFGDPPTPANFKENLEEVSPHLVHFIGHGRYRQDKVELALHSSWDPSNSFWCSEDDLKNYFNSEHHQEVRLVFFQFFEGNSIDSSLSEENTVEFKANFSGLSSKLIDTGVQGVIATQYRTTSFSAIAFNDSLYEFLVRGDDIDNAVQKARSQIISINSDKDRCIFGAPVLYVSNYQRIIELARKPSERSVVKGGTGSQGQEIPANQKSVDISKDEDRFDPKDSKLKTEDNLSLLIQKRVKAAVLKAGLQAIKPSGDSFQPNPRSKTVNQLSKTVNQCVESIDWRESLERIRQIFNRWIAEEQNTNSFSQMIDVYQAMLNELEKQMGDSQP